MIKLYGGKMRGESGSRSAIKEIVKSELETAKKNVVLIKDKAVETREMVAELAKEHVEPIMGKIRSLPIGLRGEKKRNGGQSTKDLKNE